MALMAASMLSPILKSLSLSILHCLTLCLHPARMIKSRHVAGWYGGGDRCRRAKIQHQREAVACGRQARDAISMAMVVTSWLGLLKIASMSYDEHMYISSDGLYMSTLA